MGFGGRAIRRELGMAVSSVHKILAVNRAKGAADETKQSERVGDIRMAIPAQAEAQARRDTCLCGGSPTKIAPHGLYTAALGASS
jgi:hypothetical protein